MTKILRILIKKEMKKNEKKKEIRVFLKNL
jgi:hypothetical protein